MAYPNPQIARVTIQCKYTVDKLCIYSAFFPLFLKT